MESNTLKEISVRIKEGKEKLAEVAAELKLHFVGIDDVIDDIVSKIEMWYVMPELLGRPTIINMWGMTGVGKTDLVRKLVKGIGFGDRYVETIMKDSAANNTGIQQKIQMSSVEVGESGVVLIDEIQRFRTIGRNGEELASGALDDLWTLLSDGKFSADASKRTSIYDLVQELVTAFAKRKIEDEKGMAEGDKAMSKSSSRSMIDRILSDGDSDYDYDEENMIVDFKTKEIIGVTAVGAWQARRIKTVLGISTPIYDIMKLGDEGVIELLLAALDCPDTYEGDDYTKMLIFVCGNLDEAFTSAANVEDCDTDADIIRKSTKAIDITTIKAALSKRFRPEQIARLGNNHIIYGSLSAAAFRTIIERNVDDASEKTFKMTGIRMKFHESMIDMIYRNGVFPLQGTRPLFTTIGSVIGHVTPHAVQAGSDSGQELLVVKYNDGDKKISIMSETGDVLDRSAYYGSIDTLRDEKDKQPNGRRLTSVHEAGHIISYAALFGLVPLQAVANGLNSEGFVMTSNDNSCPSAMMMNMAVGAAGFEAERFIFGDNLLVGGGATQDLMTITSTAGYFVRRMCVVKECFVLSNDDNQLFDRDLNSTNGAIRNAVKTAKETACKIVSENAECLIKLTDALFDEGKLSPERMQAIMEPYFGKLTLDMGDDVSYPYDRMYLDKVQALAGKKPPTVDEFEKKREKYAEEIRERILGYKEDEQNG